jgi:hypothetical protein
VGKTESWKCRLRFIFIAYRQIYCSKATLLGSLNLSRGVDRHVAGGRNALDGARLEELTNELTSEGATDLVVLNESVQGHGAGLLVSGGHAGVEETLGEGDAVVLLLTKLGLGPL